MPQEINAALRKGDFNLLRNLVESGADVNLQDVKNQTPLIICCLHNCKKWAEGSARLLLTFGAKVGLCDNMGRNALMYAVMYQREGLVKLFLDALDYDLTHTDKWNCTALSYATYSGNAIIETLLIKTLNKYRLFPEKLKEKEIIKDKKGFEMQQILCSNIFQEPLMTSDDPFDLCTSHGLKSKSNSFSTEKRSNDVIHHLPYKPIPDDIWEKRIKFYSRAKGHHSSACFLTEATNQPSKNALSKYSSNTNLQDKTSSNPMERNNVKTKSEHGDWREDFQNIMAMHEIKLSPSYCKEARILPFSQRRDNRLQKTQLDECKAPQIPKRGRRRSLDTMDVLLDKQSMKGNSRRRCSLAVIPLITLKGFKSSLLDEHLKQNRNSLSIPKPPIKK